MSKDYEQIIEQMQKDIVLLKRSVDKTSYVRAMVAEMFGYDLFPISSYAIGAKIEEGEIGLFMGHRIIIKKA